MEWSSRVLHHGNLKMWKIFKNFEIDEIEFCPYPEFPYAEKRNRPGFVNISQYHRPFFFFFFKFETEFNFYFNLCWRAEIIQVGLNMHLYVDIGDAS